jgi:hypothetical protein
MLRAARVLGPAAAVAAVLALPAAAPAQVDLTCELAFARLEPTTTNTLLLDTNAAYWIVTYNAVPGTRLRITADFPHARYTSWNVYDAQAMPIDALADVLLQPDAGSFNPFLPGADRRRTPRRYTAFLNFGQPPATRPPNTMYAFNPTTNQPALTGSLWLRVYIPDRGLDLAGGVALPRVTVEPASGTGTLPPDVCSQIKLPTANAAQDAIADSNGLPATGTRVGYPGRSPPTWRLFVNLSESFREVVTDSERTDQAHQQAGRLPQNRGTGIFSNKDISYVYTGTSQGHGNILVLRGRAPTFPDTRPPAATMPTGKQLRYFSFCQYEPISQRVIDCRSDDRILVDSRGFYTVVVSTPGQRPANATTRCGVTWLPWGPAPYGLLIYRHMLADPSFAQSIAKVGEPGREQAVMGDYYPSGTYLPDKAAFERRGCAAASTAPSGAAPTGESGTGEPAAAGGTPSSAASARSTGSSEGSTGNRLPFTGLALGGVAIAGLIMVSAGVAARRLGRRRAGPPDS